MRIGMVITSLTPGGGTFQLLQIANKLSKKHKVLIFTLTDESADNYDNLKKNIQIIIALQKKLYLPGTLSVFLPFVQQLILAKKIIDYDLDILNPHEWPSQWSCAFIKLFKKIPVVWTCNDVWHISGYEEIKEKRKVFIFFKKTIVQFIDSWLTKKVNCVTVLDNRIKNIVVSVYKVKTLIVQSGIDKNRYIKILPQNKAKKLLNISEKFIFLCVSIFFPHRRFEDVIVAYRDIVKKYKNLLLIIVGSDRYNSIYAQEIKDLVLKYKLNKNVKLVTDFVKENILQAYYASCDVFIFPNEKQTWGLSALEAMASSKPCVISRGSGVHEIINDGKNGFLFDSRDIEKLSFLMEKLIINKSLREVIGKNARNTVLSKYTWDIYAENMEKLFINNLKK